MSNNAARLLQVTDDATGEPQMDATATAGGDMGSGWAVAHDFERQVSDLAESLEAEKPPGDSWLQIGLIEVTVCCLLSYCCILTHE